MAVCYELLFCCPNTHSPALTPPPPWPPAAHHTLHTQAIIRLRNRLLGKGPSWRRLVEAVGWALAFSALGLCLPLAWPCQPAPTQLSAPQLGGVMPSSSTPHTALPQGLWGGVVARASAALAPTRRATLELYSCAPEGGPGGSIHPGQEGGEGAGTYYNQLATLTLTSGERC